MGHEIKLIENYPNKPYTKHEYSFLQDFHHLDHHHFHANGSSSNSFFGVQTGSNFDSFDAFPYGSSSNMEYYDYECKPFVDGHGGQVMDSLSNAGGERGFSLLNHMGLNMQETKTSSSLVVPDEDSCVTANNNHRDYYYTKVGMNKNRNPLSGITKKTWRNRKKSNVVKGQWTIEEDRLLIQLVEQHGLRKWSHIAQRLPGRIGKQCRERWHNHLRPDIKKDTWSEEEDKVLIELHSEIGNKWAEIAKKLPGRTENSIKNHWNATKRRQYSKRKCRSKHPRASLLQDYIKSLNLDSTNTGRCQGKTSTSRITNPAIPGSADSTALKAPPNQQPQALLPQYEFNEVVPDFEFDDRMFQDGCNIDTLLEEIPCVPVEDDKVFEGMKMGEAADHVSPVLMDFEVKKEMDLMELIYQGKI